MTLIISEEEFYQSIVQIEAEKDIPLYQTVEIPVNDPKQLSQGYRRWIDICPGLNLLIDDYTLQEDLVVDVADGKPGSQIELSFSLLGDNHKEKTPFGQNFFLAEWNCGKGGLFKWKSGDRILKFDIHVNVSFFKTLIAEELEQLPKPVRQGIEVQDEYEYRHLAKTTPVMQNIINQIFNCPYQGLTRRLYLESKALELIALRLEQVTYNTDTPKNKSHRLQADDIDRIHYARDILVNNLENPPSLMELSRMVGLNDCTLKKGFREVFDTTAFGYLYNYRLETARNLLETHNAKVTDVVRMVGFKDRSYFAAAFRKKFGVNPSIYLKENGKNLRNSA
ncbi:transcriptional regulator [Calothrix parasitica NIES-267]|uniref:Transcriptional regulator n=1 Tax=Calothrix parasitica NIES-267 TaxID=1973488 RepID=A0A1Z4LY10_9CYAN|nr:transcriptional regulator [Calothrix parasitica NIES-267]